MGKKRAIVFVAVFLVLTMVTAIHMYKSFKKLLLLPENIPSSLDKKLPSGFWLNFGIVYYFSPLITIVLTFGFYAVSLFLVEYVSKRLKVLGD